MKYRFDGIAKETEKFLSKGIRIKALIEELQEAYEKAIDSATTITQSTSEISVQTSKSNSSEQKMIAVASVSEQIRQEQIKSESIYKDIISLINEVNNTTYKTFLYARYVNNKSFEAIAEVLDVSTKWISQNIYPKAVEAAAIVYKKKNS